MQGLWRKAFNQCEVFDFDDTRGQGWAKKKDVQSTFGRLANYASRGTINAKFNKFAEPMFQDTREGVGIYVRLRAEHRKGTEA